MYEVQNTVFYIESDSKEKLVTTLPCAEQLPEVKQVTKPLWNQVTLAHVYGLQGGSWSMRPINQDTL